ncbi:MAG: hypothetical protein ABSH12_05250 [Endomicrobiales bacterium]
MKKNLLGCISRKTLFIDIFIFSVTTGSLLAEMPVLTDVRAEGMGEAYTAVADQSTALDWNPAGLGTMQRTDLTALYSQSLVDTQYTNFSYGHPCSFGGIAVGWSRVSNDFEKTSAQDQSLGTGSVSNDVVMAGFGYNGLPVALGMTVRYFSERIDPELLSGYAFDLGALYTYKQCRFGWVWKNVLSSSLEGTGIAGNNVSEVVPPIMRAGFAWVLPVDFDVRDLGNGSNDQLQKSEIWHFTLTSALDVDIPVYSQQVLAISPGLEIGVRDLIAIRLGLSQLQDFRVGLSIKTKIVSFDYAFLFNPSLTNTQMLSTSLYFGT